MTNIDFFNATPNIIRITFGGVMVSWLCWIAIVIFDKQPFDPFVKTIALSIVLWGMLFSLYRTLQVERFFLNDKEEFLGSARGIIFFNKTHRYLYADISSIELRSAYINFKRDRNPTLTSTKRYYCVLIFNDDELYMKGSCNEEETKSHVREIAKHLNKPYKVDFDAENRSKASEIKILRVLFLLSVFLLGMYGLYHFIVAV